MTTSRSFFALCRKYKVKKLYAFGSILTPRFNEHSDVDILVDFNSEIDHINYADNFFDFYHALKALFDRDVDLVDKSSVKNPYFKEELEETQRLVNKPLGLAYPWYRPYHKTARCRRAIKIGWRSTVGWRGYRH